MNSLSGYITDIEVSGSLSLVCVSISDMLELKAIVIETPETASYLENGREIKVLFKETEVVIGTREDHSISLQNRITGTIRLIERGRLISRLIVQTEVGEIVSIISTHAVEQLELKEKMAVTAMVKLNEVMLSE